MIFAVLARARPLRRPPTTPPLVLLMPPALNPPEPKLPPGLPTLEQHLKGLTRPTWGARAIPLPRYHQPAEPNLCNSSSICLQAHANSGAPAQQATPQAPLPSPLYPWMRSQFGKKLFYFLFVSELQFHSIPSLCADSVDSGWQSSSQEWDSSSDLEFGFDVGRI